MNDYKHSMGRRIKEKRKELKLTQDEISEMLDISVKHFGEVERGIAGLSVENLIKLSEILCVSIDYLVKGEIDNNKWSQTLSLFEQIPEEKEQTFKQLIATGIALIK